MFRKVILLSVGIIFMLQTVAFGSMDKNISNLFKKDQPIKVYVKGFTNESGNKALSAESFKKELENAFTTRKSVTFKIVAIPQESDIEVSGVIKRGGYLERGPIEPTVSLETAAIDAVAAMTENYVNMEVAFTLVNPKTGKVVLEKDVYDYERKTMTEAESFPIIYDKVARKFVAKTFGKGKK